MFWWRVWFMCLRFVSCQPRHVGFRTYDSGSLRYADSAVVLWCS
uniref:Uncharacterized protein n=1 Tax=Arundo donax TaxID=35708 RepID=A0A0A8ZKP9_ARUDO